jgi:hypothetical protein
VILGKELQWLTWNAATLHCFEFCDLLVSICVLIYVGNTAMSSFTMHITQREWDRVSMKPTVEVVDDVQYYLQSLRTSGCRKLRHFLPFFESDWRDEADFKVLQLLFKTKFHLPHHFDYVMYIKAILEDNVVAMANISTYHWVLLMLMNALWYVIMVEVLPLWELDTTPMDGICIVDCANADSGAHRRLASAGPKICSAHMLDDECGYNDTELAGALDELRNISGSQGGVYWNQCAKCNEPQEEVCHANPTASFCSFAFGFYALKCCMECAIQVDITPEQTMLSLAAYALCGWLIVLGQARVNTSISNRMSHILTMHDADHDDKVPILLTKLQQKLRNRLNTRLSMPDDDETADYDGETKIIESTVGELHNQRCIVMEGDADEPETDHIMVFKKSSKDSNDILSLRSCETLMFLTQFFQLVIDFYFGFYAVHMQQRVHIAFEVCVVAQFACLVTSSSMLACLRPVVFLLFWTGCVDRSERNNSGSLPARILVHAVLVGPFFGMIYLLMMTTRKLSLLVGVLHLNDEAVSGVLEHMEMVKSIRRRIQDTLRKIGIARGKPKPKEAEELLVRAQKGELAILTDLSQRDDLRTGRITRREMQEIIFSSDASEYLTIETKDLAEFLDRKSFAAYMLESQADQATAQTARTFLLGEDDNEFDDTIEITEFSSYLVRFIAEVIHRAQELAPEKVLRSKMKKFRAQVTALDSVDDDALEHAHDLARCKHIFRTTDADGSGAVSNIELRAALRKYKVNITKEEFKHIFRVIDPDQSKSMTMDEWVDFMMATDHDLELQTSEASKLQQKSNAEKGDSLEVFVGEGVGIFLGDRAGRMIGGVVGQAVRHQPGLSRATMCHAQTLCLPCRRLSSHRPSYCQLPFVHITEHAGLRAVCRRMSLEAP